MNRGKRCIVTARESEERKNLCTVIITATTIICVLIFLLFLEDLLFVEWLLESILLLSNFNSSFNLTILPWQQHDEKEEIVQVIQQVDHPPTTID